MNIHEVKTDEKIEFFTSLTDAKRYAKAHDSVVSVISFELTKRGVNRLCRDLCARHFWDRETDPAVPNKIIRITANKPPEPDPAYPENR